MRAKARDEKKIAVVAMADMPSWLSCQSITPNLIRAYASFRGRSRIFEISSRNFIESSVSAARDILAFDPDVIAFVEHQPHPLSALQTIKAVYGARKIPDLVFHIYGDFTLLAREWIHSSPYLRGNDCQFICASKRQRSLLGRFLQDPRSIEVLPFMVDSRKYCSSSALRARWRARLRIGKEDRLLLYTGRLSLQKNISLLISAFAEMAEVDPGLYLVLAGRTDDLGAPLFGWTSSFGTDYRALSAAIGRLPTDTRRRIVSTGLVDSSVLNGLYNASDCFVSLSLHHDEDFGLSAAEALCSGSPICLTNWGGFSDFTENPENGISIPVFLGTGGLRINRTYFIDKLRALLGRDEPWEKRRERSERNRNAYSVRQMKHQLAALMSKERPPFQGFSPFLGQLAFHSQMDFAVHRGGPQKGKLYERVYSAYLGPQQL